MINCIACARKRSQATASTIPICGQCWEDINALEVSERIEVIIKLREAHSKGVIGECLSDILENLRTITAKSADPLAFAMNPSGNN